MVIWGWVSDRMGERRWNLFWGCVAATVGLVIARECVGAALGGHAGMSIAAIVPAAKGPSRAVDVA